LDAESQSKNRGLDSWPLYHVIVYAGQKLPAYYEDRLSWVSTPLTRLYTTGLAYAHCHWHCVGGLAVFVVARSVQSGSEYDRCFVIVYMLVLESRKIFKVNYRVTESYLGGCYINFLLILTFTSVKMIWSDWLDLDADSCKDEKRWAAWVLSQYGYVREIAPPPTGLEWCRIKWRSPVVWLSGV